MKKLIIISLLVGLVLMSGSAMISGEKVKLLWTTCCAQSDRHVLFKNIAEQYMATHPNVEIQWMYPTGNYTTNMQVYFAAGTAPDVMWIGSTIWSFADLLLPLDDIVLKDAGAKSIIPAILKLTQWQGRQIGLSYGANAHAMMYNKDHLNQAGLSTPGRNWTYDDLLRMAKQLTRDQNGDGLPDQYGTHLYAANQWALTAGGDFYTPDQKQTRLANPVTVEMTQLAADMASGVLGVSPVPEDLTAAVKGKVSIRNIGIFDVPAFRAANFDWDVQKMPAFVYNGQRYENTFTSLEAWAIPNTSKHPAEAKEFLSYLLSKNVMQQITASGIVIPTQRTMTEQFAKSPAPPANLTAFLDALDNGHQLSLSHPYGGDVVNWYSTQQSWKDMWAGKAPARTVLQELATTINTMLDRFWAARK